MPVSICAVPLSDDAWISVGPITDHLSDAWPGLPEISDVAETAQTVSFKVGLAHVVLGRMPVPISWDDLNGPCSAAMLWPEAADDLRQHPAHIIVTVSAETDPVALATLLTQVTTAILSTNASATGVFWSNAAKVIRRDIFLDLVEEILPYGPPMHLWVDYRIRSDNAESSSGFSMGMKALGHMELEAAQVPESPDGLMERFMNIGSYLIEIGPVIGDGALIGEDADEKIRVRHVPSVFGHEGKVLSLSYES